MTDQIREGDKTATEEWSAEPSKHPRLVALWSGGGLSCFLPRAGRCVMGRSRDCNVVLDHKSVSRRHAAVDVADGLWLEDFGSANGTKVRGKRLAPQERVQFGWDEPVEIGAVVVIVRPPGERPEPKPEKPGPSPAMEEVNRWIQLVAGTDMSVLLLGETGVGKGYLARQVHERSPRARGPFMHINCAALPEHLLESELFGHERGAFTGAVQSKLGLLEATSGGSVFLDEVGDLPMATQAKLLVALERREVMPVGALKPRPFDVRLVSATNKHLEECIVRGEFRQDLYFRLSGLPILVPPLRERKNEIPELAALFVVEAAQRLRCPQPTLSERALAALASHDWPGNIRELMTVLERAMLLGPGLLTAAHIEAAFGRRLGPMPATAPSPSSGPQPLDAAALDAERTKIILALEDCAGNQSRAARLLGISRGTLITRIAEFGLPRPRK